MTPPTRADIKHNKILPHWIATCLRRIAAQGLDDREAATALMEAIGSCGCDLLEDYQYQTLDDLRTNPGSMKFDQDGEIANPLTMLDDVTRVRRLFRQRFGADLSAWDANASKEATEALIHDTIADHLAGNEFKAQEKELHLNHSAKLEC